MRGVELAKQSPGAEHELGSHAPSSTPAPGSSLRGGVKCSPPCPVNLPRQGSIRSSTASGFAPTCSSAGELRPMLRGATWPISSAAPPTGKRLACFAQCAVAPARSNLSHPTDSKANIVLDIAESSLYSKQRNEVEVVANKTARREPGQAAKEGQAPMATVKQDTRSKPPVDLALYVLIRKSAAILEQVERKLAGKEAA